MATYFCNSCKKDISKSNKAKHERTNIHQRLSNNTYGGDLQSFSSKLPDFLWSKYPGEHHLPSYNYLGPGTRLDIRLDENDNPKPGEQPINRVDAAAYKHDLAYRDKDIRSRQKADIDLIQDLNEINKPTLKESIAKVIAKGAMKAKIVLGGEIDHPKQASPPPKQASPLPKQALLLADELHKEYRRPVEYLKIKVFNKDDIWGADLVEMPNMKGNNDLKYILTIIDLYTK